MKGFERPLIKTLIPGKKSLNLSKKLQNLECRNITFVAEDYPVFLEKSYMMNVWDVDGNRFVDLTSFFGVSFIGHNHPIVQKCLKSPDLINGLGDVLPSESKVTLLEELNDFAGGGYRGILGQNGADAVEAAIKTAFLYTGKPGIIAFEGGYHGLSFGALMTTYNSKFRDPFSVYLPAHTEYFSFPDGGEGSEMILEQIDKYMKMKDNVGLVLMELIQARGGVRIFPAEFVKGIAEICRKYRVVLAFDEIYTGLGRCGKPFCFEYYGVIPDILILGKALSSSFPISVMMGKEKIMEAWPTSTGEAIHTSTFLGHPLISKIAFEVVKYIRRNRLWENASEMGEYILKKLIPLREKYQNLVKDIRGKGLLIGIEIEGASVFDISRELLKRGYITLSSGLRGEVLELTPPVAITKKIVDEFVLVFEDVLKLWTSTRR